MKILLKIAFLFFLIHPAYGQKINKAVDQLMNENFSDNAPGATILVAKNGKVIYEKAFGMANLELSVPLKTNHVFEIGSVSKQFTAVAILMLQERGKLNVNDPITKYLPHYPTHGHTITIHHLLTHTSGIVNYTNLDEWTKIWRQDLTVKEVIDIFKNEPMDFAPGEKFSYSNSGYILLGAIIENASGSSYQEFIENQIFEPVGMKQSYYGSHKTIIPERASGYQKNNEEITNAEFLSMTQPYAAGSLMSTVGDLNLWNEALKSNKLISEESKNLAQKDYDLNNGESTNYGYGWMPNEVQGSKCVEHGGGIFGFFSFVVYLPTEDIFVAILSNTDYNNVSDIAIKVAAIAMGKPYGDEKEISLSAKELQRWAGNYEFEDGTFRVITFEDGKLYSQRNGGTKYQIHPLTENGFYFEDSFTRLLFLADLNNIPMKVISMHRGNRAVAFYTDKEIEVKEEVAVDENKLEKFVGDYEIAPNFILSITLENGVLMSQATNQAKVQLYAESETKFFLKVVDAQVEFFEGEDGKISHLILYQGGQEIKCMKK